MLKSQNTETQTPSLGKARVTPQELSEALAAIETRKQAEASRLAGTIPIEDAVSELHLDSTPEEIWAEVNAQRQKQAQEKQAQEQVRLAALGISKRFTAPARVKSPRWMAIFTPLLLLWVFVQTGIIPHFWTRPHQSAASAAQLQKLAVIPDGKEVYADNAALIQISEGKPLTQVTVDENQNDNRWEMFKQGGHVYLRGFIASANSLQPLQGKPLNVYNDDNSGELNLERTSNITLRVDNIPLQKSGGDDGFSEVTVPNFQPDPLTTLSPWH